MEEVKASNKWNVKTLCEVEHEPVEFLWKPYLPIGEYTVISAAGGTGKTMAVCGIAATLSHGVIPNGTEIIEPVRSLFISAEDRASIFLERLEASAADLNYIDVLDDSASLGLSMVKRDEKNVAVTDMSDFEAIITQSNAKLVVIDPLHAFIGNIDMNRVNIIRPILQGIACLAKKCQCSIVVIEHLSKRMQTENVNNGTLGSVDIASASRSMLRVVSDNPTEDPNRRVMVHTKSNYAALGKSVVFEIHEGGGVIWAGESEITKEMLEAAPRRNQSLAEYIKEHSVESSGKDFDEIVANIFTHLARTQPRENEFYTNDYLKKHYPAYFKDTVKSRINKKVTNLCGKNNVVIHASDSPKEDRFGNKGRGIEIIRYTGLPF